MLKTAILPWHQSEWLQLTEALRNHHLPHALLIMGLSGLGQQKLADALAQTVLCEKKIACGNCHSCQLWQAKTHPDFTLVEPLADSPTIKIDQIRAIIDSVNQTAMLNGYRVIIIHKAASMTLAAANALLKTLEEPSANTLIILINEQNTLPLTIKSRCQKILIKKPSRAQALNWLKEQLSGSSVDYELLLNISEGAPLKALALVADNQLSVREDFYQGLFNLSVGTAHPLDLALKWQDQNLLFLMNLLFSFLKDLLWFKLSFGKAILMNTDYVSQFEKMTIDRQKLTDYLDLVQLRFKEMTFMQNLNKQLFLEELLIQWTVLNVSG